jgi:hypothetical protein
MAWTAYFQNAVNRDGRWAFSIVYTDGNRKVLREYAVDRIDDEAVKSAARNEIASLDVVDAGSGKLTITDGSVLDLAPPVVVDPPLTPEEVARLQFVGDLRALRRLEAAAGFGFIPADDQRISDLRSTLTKGWKDEYLGAL